MRARKVLFMTHAAQYGGAEMSLLDIMCGLNRSAIEPTLVSFTDGPLVEDARGRGVNAVVVNTDDSIVKAKRSDFAISPSAPLKAAAAYLKMIPAIKKLEELIRSEKADVVYTNTSKAHILGGLSAARAGVPVVWHYRDFPASKTLRMFYSSMASANADAVICNSKFTAEQFSNHKNVRVVYSGIPADKVVSGRSAGEIRGELGIPVGAPVAGTVGRLERWKGVHVFIKAAREIKNNIPESVFVVVGSPIYGYESYESELRAQAKDAGLADSVIFTGFRKDVYDVMSALDVYVHPSVEPEPFGRGIVEAMLLGKPVVAAASGGPMEIVADGSSGFLAQPGDSEKLAAAVTRFFKDRELAVEMGARGRERAQSRFGLEKTLSEIEKIIMRAGKK